MVAAYSGDAPHPVETRARLLGGGIKSQYVGTFSAWRRSGLADVLGKTALVFLYEK